MTNREVFCQCMSFTRALCLLSLGVLLCTTQALAWNTNQFMRNMGSNMDVQQDYQQRQVQLQAQQAQSQLLQQQVQQQQQSIQAQQQYTTRLRATSQEAASAIQECRNKRASGQLKTYVESTECSNPKIVAAYQRAGYPYMDLIALWTAKRREIAEQEDMHRMTEVQAQAKGAELMSEISDTERHRNLEAMNAQAQAATVQASQMQALGSFQSTQPEPQPRQTHISCTHMDYGNMGSTDCNTH